MDHTRNRDILPWSRLGLATLMLTGCVALQAASLPNAGRLIPDRPGAERPQLPEYLPETERPGLDIPQAPLDSSPQDQSGQLGLELKGVRFEGNRVFSDAELQAIAEPFVGRWVSLAELEELRYRLTRHYTDLGYSNSGAIIPLGQVVDDGVVTYAIREGQLDQVRISGTERLRPDYVQTRVWPDAQETFNIQRLQERFQLLLQDPLIERMDGRLVPGVEQGSMLLDLQVTRAQPYRLDLLVDNSRAPSSGAERARLGATIYNLAGQGDQLDLAIEGSEGASNGEIGFSIPLNQQDTRLSLRFDNTDSSVIEEPLAAIDIENEYQAFEATLSHPLWRELSGHLLLGGTLSHRSNQSFLLGEPFPFSEGEEADGTSTVTALRLWQDYQLRRSDWVLAARSTLSVGLDWFDATVHDDGRPDGEFVSWLGQVQYAQRVLQGAQAVVRADVQLSSNELLPLERFALGGMNTVRGYRENTLVRDQAYLLSAELRYPLFADSGYGRFEVIPFVDYGRAWNKGDYGAGEDLFGAGIGLHWNYKDRIDATLYVAHDIKQAPDAPEYNLQDDGIHFRLNIGIL